MNIADPSFFAIDLQFACDHIAASIGTLYFSKLLSVHELSGAECANNFVWKFFT